mgnify:FL=1|tara:strand:- start:11505 stop:12032 length:528 start_codon:yes stop_codon:yes gene_type:complete
MEKRNKIKKIVFTGPECSGKSTLSKAIAQKMQLPLVEEYARQYLNSLGRNYIYSDLAQIAKGQLNAEKKAIDHIKKHTTIICDTDLQVIKIWSQKKFGKCASFILNNQDIKAYYILCRPDFKWEYDPLRENENDRMSLFEIYHQDLIQNNANFIIASGPLNERISCIQDVIRKMI